MTVTVTLFLRRIVNSVENRAKGSIFIDQQKLSTELGSIVILQATRLLEN